MSTNPQPVRTFEGNHSQAQMGSLLRRGLALSLAYLMIPIGIGDVYAQSYGQDAPPPAPDQQYGQQYNPQYGQQYGPQYGQQYNPQYGQQYGQQNGQYGEPGYYQPLSPDQLDQLVAPVALYPDALVAQVLAASTYPTEVVDADRWMQSYEGYGPSQVAQMANGLPWDPSVKSLTAFPSVMDNMAQNLDWTTQLGNAYYNQPQDVMEAVQAMRQQAYDSGYLRTTPQMDVNYSPEYVSIAPANPDVVYVPYYNPWDVYGPVINPWYSYDPPPAPRDLSYGGLSIGFGAGIAVIAFSHWGWGWGHWRPDWRDREVYHGGDRYISRSRSVFNRGHFGDFDRHYARTDFRRDNHGHARGFKRQNQLRGGPNANFHVVPGNQQMRNRGLQRLNQRQEQLNRNQPKMNHAPQNNQRAPQRFGGRPRQNFNQRPQHPNPAQPNRPHPTLNRMQPQLNRNQPKMNHAPQNNQRAPQRFDGRPQQNFHQPQQMQNRPQPQFQQNRNQQNFNRGRQPQKQGRQFQGRPNNRPENNHRPQTNNHPQNNNRPVKHPPVHPDHPGNGAGRR